MALWVSLVRAAEEDQDSGGSKSGREAGQEAGNWAGSARKSQDWARVVLTAGGFQAAVKRHAKERHEARKSHGA